MPGSVTGVAFAYDRRGSGEPLVLLHGSGSDRRAWRRVVDRLVHARDVLTLDLPGHGETPPLGRALPPTAEGFAVALIAWLEERGLGGAHLAGNSIGGWTALEVAKRGRGASVTAVCPAGLWQEHSPRLTQASLRASRALARRVWRRADALTRSTVVRSLLFAQVAGRPWRIPAEDAAAALVALGTSDGFDEHLDATVRQRFEGGQAITVPVTVAWGLSDRLLPRRVRRTERLPAHTRVLKEHGWGHVPMWDDPHGVARVLLDGSSRAPVED